MKCRAGDRDTMADHTTTLPTLIDTSRRRLSTRRARRLSTVALLADIPEEAAVIATGPQPRVDNVMFYRNESPT
jgi:hypothetical protein